MESSQLIKTFVIRDIHDNDNSEINTLMPGMFDLLDPNKETNESNYPITYPSFWQHSFLGQKLAAIVYWGNLVTENFRNESNKHSPNIFSFNPANIPTLSVRASIMMKWVYARKLYDKDIKNKLLENFESIENINIDEKLISCPDIWKSIYLISRNLYLTLMDIRLISKKNLDLIFPSMAQVYYIQWKVLRALVITLITLKNKNKLPNDIEEDISSFRSITVYVQHKLQKIDENVGGRMLIAPSHFDYEYILIRTKSNLRDVENLIDPTSRIRMSVLQQKYFLHDDHNDQEFRMDWILGHMFSPIAKLLLKYIDNIDKEIHTQIPPYSE